MGSNERKVGSGQGVKVLQRLMHPLSILLGRRTQGLLIGDIFSVGTSRCAGAAGAWSRGGFQPTSISWQGEIWQSVLHGSLQLNFPVLSASSESLEHPKQQQNWEEKKENKRGVSVVLSPLMAAACFSGTEELFLLSYSPCHLPSPCVLGGMRTGRMGRHGGKPAPQDVPALSTVVDSFGYTIQQMMLAIL